MIIRKLAMILISILVFEGLAFGELSIPQIADKYAPSVVSIAVGEDIVALGNPEGLEGAISIGAISDVIKAEDIEFIQVTAPISPGSSGGPVFSLNGKVIGIATAFLDLGQNLNLAMPVNYLKTLKSVRLKLGSLPRMTMKIEATVRGKAFLEVLDIRHGITNNAHPSPHNRGLDHGSYDPSVAGPGTVYFKNGKKLLCDRAWKDGSTIFLVIHGKKVAVGYDEREIDMERSFI